MINLKKFGFDFIEIPRLKIQMSQTEVTQKLYSLVMNANPSTFNAPFNPVESVSWYDAIYFCNRLSDRLGLTPAYALNGSLDVGDWDYVPHKCKGISGVLELNRKATGFRLPSLAEYKYAINCWEDFLYSGSDEIEEVGWYKDNSNGSPHHVATKKANCIGLYDMTGNVSEWVNNFVEPGFRYYAGGSYDSIESLCDREEYHLYKAKDRAFDIGFRIVAAI